MSKKIEDPDYLSSLPRGALWTIAADMDIQTLTNLCQSNTKLNDKLCNNRGYWFYRIQHEFGDVLIPNRLRDRCLNNPKCIYDILSAKDLFMFGDNYPGQLGTGDNRDRNVPTLILDNVLSVSCGWNHTGITGKRKL